MAQLLHQTKSFLARPRLRSLSKLKSKRVGNMPSIIVTSFCTDLVAIPSMILGAAVAIDSGWLYCKLWMDVQNPADKLIDEYGNQDPKEVLAPTDIEHMFRVLIIAYYVALVGGLTQFVMSYWLFLAKGKFGGSLARKTWVCGHLFGICALAVGFLGAFTLETPPATRLKVFLGITGLDFILHIYFLWFGYMLARARAGHTWNDMNPI